MEPARLLSALDQRHLFGQAELSSVQTANAQTDAPTPPAFNTIRLLGIIAATRPDQPAYALLAREGQTSQVIREGDEIDRGLRLIKVHPKDIEILGAGQSFKLSLPAPHQP